MQALSNYAQPVRIWLLRFLPNALTLPPGERRRMVAGAGLGLLITGLASHWLQPEALAWLVAPIGASAVLVFAVPSSPLAQPWSVVGGNTVSAMVGIACALAIPDTTLAAACAVALAIGAMALSRCLHPPGGAVALLVVLSPHPSWSFAVFPVLGNSLLLVSVGVVYNSLTGRPYPHKHSPVPDAAHATDPGLFSRADLDAALRQYNQVLDVDPDDLVALLRTAQASAYQRNFGELRCRDIMTAQPLAVEFGTALHDAWALMRRSKVKALPVVDRARRVVGIVTMADFLRHARLDEHTGLATRLQNMLRPSKLLQTDRPEVVGQLMTRQVRVASAERHAVELLPLFSQAGHHHVPIIDAEMRLVGIVTQSDLVRTLSRAVQLG